MSWKTLKNYWPEILIFGAVLFFLREVLFLGKIFIAQDIDLGDFVLGAVPQTNYLAQALHQGRFPLWAPEFYSGFPFAVNGESGLYYPLNLLFFYLFSPQIAWGLHALFTFLLLGFSTFYFLRNLDLSKEASLVGTLSFTFASGLIARIVHLPIIETLAYLPLSLILTKRFFATRNPLLLLAISAFLSFQILNFNPPTTFVCFFVYLLYFLFLTVTTITRTKKLVVNLLCLLCLFSLSFLLSAVQLIPAAKIASSSIRGQGISEKEAKEFPFTPKELAYFLHPTAFGNPATGTYRSPDPEHFVFFWENNAYIGLLGFVLGILGLILLWRKDRHVFFFGSLFIISLILALGQFTPFFFILRLPPFSFFRAPGRFIMPAMFSLAVLAGFGFQALTQRFASKRSLVGILAAAFILVDLFSFDLFYNPTYDAKKWLSPPQTAEFIKKDKSDFRIYAPGELDAFNALPPGWQDLKPYFNLREGIPPLTGLLYGLNEAEGFRLGLVPKRLLTWEATLQNNFKADRESGTAVPNPLALKMLRLKNVKYIVTHYKIDSPDFEIRKQVDFDTGQASFYVYELSSPLPHTFIVHEARSFPNSDQLTKEFSQEEFDPLKEVLLEESFEKLTVNTAPSFNKAEVVQYLPEKVVIRAKTDLPGFLVLTDTNFPGWEARIDGQPAKIYQADFLFRAVRIEPGEHQVTFEYKPKEVYLGAMISLTTFAVVVIFSFFWLVRKQLRARVNPFFGRL